MNKGELIAAMADAAGISKADAAKAMDAALDAIANTLKDGNKVAILGFGTFSVSHRPAREGRNPATGETIKIAARNVVKFKAGKALNEKVN